MTLELTAISSLRSTVAEWRRAGARVALVPTMGALHAGHIALLKHAQSLADKVVVSIFVNPTQFGPNEDFERYPRPLANDLALLREAGADAAWLPTAEQMYPHGFATTVHVRGISEGLDGAARPGHFDGVATVVSKLLLQVAPDVALFGEKDYQQLCVIRRLVADLDIAIEIVGVPTVREADGLAMSSRNSYLDQKQRAIATKLNQVMRHSAFVLCNDQRDVQETLAKAAQLILDGGFDAVDYVALCDAQTLAPMAQYRAPARLLIAARIGTTRLIDNIEV